MRVLDLFAGSGAISIEALSRGAGYIFCNDLNPSIIKHLENVIKDLRSPDLNNKTNNNINNIFKLSNINTLDLLKQSPDYFNQQAFDIIILDPPFNKDLIKICLENLILNNWLNFNKPNYSPLIYFEAENNLSINNILSNILENINNHNLNEFNLNIIKHKSAGKVIYGLITVSKI